eukprot:PITA_13100
MVVRRFADLGHKYVPLHKRLKHIKLRLKEWNKKDFGKIFVEKKSMETKLKELNQALITNGFYKVKSEQADKHHQEWEKLCKEEEIFWRQNSRVQWLKEGERNTRFFHRSTIPIRAHNRISSILNEYGELQTSHKNIEAVLVQHFRGITKENNSDKRKCIKDITRHIPKLVSREDNFNFNKLVIEEEVSEVLKEMQNGKAAGPNCFNVDFFKAYWNIFKQDILNVVEDSRRNKTILKALKTSFISLIPKQDSALTADKYRPIALCNVVYKIISKVLASRLKHLLPSLILGEQFSYVEGRQILNNIIQAHEVLTAFGFDHNCVSQVMSLVTSSSFLILVNGSPSEIFTPSRGLRQGEPLSPFLFILMMEGLGRSIKQAKVLGKIKGLQLKENDQAVIHQQFVDDTMLQGIPTVKEASAYKKILNDFALSTLMEVNLSKSKIFFLNTNIAIQRNMSRILGFQRDSIPSKYMGIPLTARPMHKSIWEPVLIKMQDKVKKWTISRLVLTKDILQSIPVFILSALPAPEGVLQQFRNI